MSPLGEQNQEIQKAEVNIEPERPELDKMLQIESWSLKDWDEKYKSKEITVYKKKEEDSPVVLIKAYLSLDNVAPAQVFRLLYDIELRKKWDKTLATFYNFGKVSEEVDHLYCLINTPFGISTRDVCQRRTVVSNYKDTAHMIHFTSVERPDCPPVKGVIRATTFISGYIIRPHGPEGRGTAMTMMTQTDIRVNSTHSRV